MSENKVKNLSDKLGDLLARGVSTVEKNTYEKAEIIPKEKPKKNIPVEEVAPIEEEVQAIEPMVEEQLEEAVVETAPETEEVAEEPVIKESLVEEVAEEPVIEESLVEEAAEEPVIEESLVEEAAEEPVIEESPVEEVEAKVSAISPEELAAAMDDSSPYKPAEPVSSNPNVSKISAEELAAAMAEMNPQASNEEKLLEKETLKTNRKDNDIIILTDEEFEAFDAAFDKALAEDLEKEKNAGKTVEEESLAVEEVNENTENLIFKTDEETDVVEEEKDFSEEEVVNELDTAEEVVEEQFDEEPVDEEFEASEEVASEEEAIEEATLEELEDTTEELEESDADETVDETSEQTNGEAKVTAVSAAEIAAMKAAFDNVKVSSYEIEEVEQKDEENEIDLEVENETTPVKKVLTPEEIEKQKRDEEMLSKLDEETRREYEFLTRKYSRNPISDQNKVETAATGEYDEEFDFEKRTDIKRVTASGKKKPLLIATICIALVIAIFLPVYFLVLAKPKAEPVVFTALEINQNNIYQYKGSNIELNNVYMIARYSDGSIKKIACTKDNISSKPTFVTDDLYVEDTNYNSATLQFTYENKSVNLTVNLASLAFDSLDVRVFNTSQLEVGKKFELSNFDLFKVYTATGTLGGLPSEIRQIVTLDSASDITVTVTKGLDSVTKTFAEVYANGFIFEEAGDYTITFALNGVTANVIVVVPTPPASEPPIEP